MITGPDQLTAGFLSESLGATIDQVVSAERIGTGQMSRNYRLELRGDGPATIVAKVPAEDPAVRELGAGSYLREFTFYAELAGRIVQGVAKCHHHQISETGHEFVLLLEDLAPAVQGDQIEGCSLAQAELALDNLASIHASGWNDERVSAHPVLDRTDTTMIDALYPVAHDQFLDRYRDRLGPQTVPVLDAFRDRVAHWLANQTGPKTIVHGDYRLDNLLFTASSVVAVDWQTVAAGPPARDVAYFLGNSLLPEHRQANEGELIDRYVGSLAARGITYRTDAFMADYALGAWLGPLVTVVGAWVATRTDRGDDMFIAMADRAAVQIIDHGSLSWL